MSGLGDQLQSEIEELLVRLAQEIGPLSTLAYVERIAERMRDEIEES